MLFYSNSSDKPFIIGTCKSVVSGGLVLDFRNLRYVTMVADCGSITEASKRLFISQPSLSYIIARVEQDIGVLLFNRKNYPLTLTYAGEKYVDTARKILRLSDNLQRELMDIGLGEKGRITFGIPTERAGYMLPRVIPSYRKMFPKVEVGIYEAMSDELLTSLLRDEINFYIVPRGRKELPGGLQTELVYKEKLYLIAAPDTVQAEDLEDPGCQIVSASFMNRQPFIPLKRGHAIRKRTDAIFKKKKISPDISMEVSSCISAVQLATSGLGITIVPQRALDALGGIGRFHCYQYTETPDTWDVNVVYKADAYLDRAERGFIDLLKETFAEG